MHVPVFMPLYYLKARPENDATACSGSAILFAFFFVNSPAFWN